MALVTAFVGAVVGGEEPLNVLQLLWVNMIMDSMGALALATEDPVPELLLLKPHGRDEPLITPRMWTHIGTQGAYQVRTGLWLLSRQYQVGKGASTAHQTGLGACGKACEHAPTTHTTRNSAFLTPIGAFNCASAAVLDVLNAVRAAQALQPLRAGL